MGMRAYRDAIGAVPDTARAMLARGLADLEDKIAALRSFSDYVVSKT